MDPAAASPSPVETTGGAGVYRRGFTVMEVLIALALAAALAAVVLPVSMSWLPAAGLDEAPARLESALALARADAQRRGVVVEVVAVRLGSGDVELRGRDLEEDEEADSPRETAPGSGSLAALPRGVSLGWADASADDEAVEEGAQTDAIANDGEPVVIALALPDGRLLAAREGASLRAAGADGRRLELQINGWTGAVTARPGVPARDDGLMDRPPEDPAEAP